LWESVGGASPLPAPKRMSQTNGSSPDLLKIGDFAELVGTNLRTLRYYEELGLIEPAERSAGGFRYYRPTDANRVQLIRDLQDLGLHLDRIRELVGRRGENEARQALAQRVGAALRAHDSLLEERMSRLEAQRKRIREALCKLGACSLCEHNPNPSNNFCEPCACDGASLPDLLSALF